MTDGQDKSSRALDSFDRAILRLVQADNKLPQRRIGEAVNLSAAAVQRRIAAMEAAGVIARNVAVVDPDAVPLTITSIVEVQLINEHAPTVAQAQRLFLATPEVQQCYYVTGGVSFVLVIVTTDMRAYSALTKSLFAEKDFIASYRSLIALDRVKADTSIIIP
ncbi:Lrp/AsnC family transcriptional regulator [Sphingomonas sp. HITSZ_GF]|uniref:Lrp/AsnC family transcriptional regulator n=1 Tax=Sphingomonas sp. HITSZ_GF TaxID=3037247 RepID=UPI00240D2AFF|nr:Lrp/AsnC family transcriptional regulator [Sphingomonas sp. HITSZ_GF]MDG2535951.1 Lrp/AsnC family transcriptional regulator [Sphingomonas sp. HITSZ_GF]